jgi:hypothetical protein
MDPELDDERGPSSRIRDSDDERPRATGRDHRARSGLVDMDDTIVDDDSDDDCGFVGVEDLEALSRAGRDCSRAMADIVGIGGTTEGGKGGGDARGLRIDLGRRVVVASAGRRRCHRDGGGGDGATFPAAVGGGDAVAGGGAVDGDRQREGGFGRTAPAAVASPAVVPPAPVPPVDDGDAPYDEEDEGEDGDDGDRDDRTSDASSSAGGAGVSGGGAGGASSATSSSAAASASASASSAPSGVGVGAGSSSADWKHKTSPLPLPEMVHAMGPIMTRTSLRSLVMKRWNPSYWMQYGGHTLFVFRSRDHMVRRE